MIDSHRMSHEIAKNININFGAALNNIFIVLILVCNNLPVYSETLQWVVSRIMSKTTPQQCNRTKNGGRFSRDATGALGEHINPVLTFLTHF